MTLSLEQLGYKLLQTCILQMYSLDLRKISA